MGSKFLPPVVIASEIRCGLEQVGARLAVESRHADAVHHPKVRVLYEIRGILPAMRQSADVAQQRAAILVEQ